MENKKAKDIVPVLKVQLDGFGQTLIIECSKANSLLEDFDCGSTGDKWIIEKSEMTRLELENLPEFDGW